MKKLSRKYVISLINIAAALFSTAAVANTLDKIRDEGTVTIGIANEVPYGYTT